MNTISRLALVTLLTFLPLYSNSADLAPLSGISEESLRELFETADLVVVGKFDGIASISDQETLGEFLDFQDLLLIPERILKSVSELPPQVYVRVPLDVLPYKDWLVTRGEIREMRREAREARRKFLLDQAENAELMLRQGNITPETYEEFRDFINTALISTQTMEMRRAIPMSAHGERNQAKDIIIYSDTDYIVFLREIPETKTNTEKVFSFGGNFEGIFSGTHLLEIEHRLNRDEL